MKAFPSPQACVGLCSVPASALMALVARPAKSCLRIQVMLGMSRSVGRPVGRTMVGIVSAGRSPVVVAMRSTTKAGPGEAASVI